MNTTEDSKNLLFKSECDNQNRRPINFYETENTEEDWWPSESASSTASYYSDSDRSAADWESAIESTGEVFYIESVADDNDDKTSNNYPIHEEPPVEFVRRRSVRSGRFMQFIKRKESKRFNNKNKKLPVDNAAAKNEDLEKKKSEYRGVKFEDFQAGEVHEITLHVDPELKHKLGRRASLCEAYFGIIPGVSSDNIRVIVAGFIPDREAMRNKDIKIGDWLRNINSQEITSQTLESILSTHIVEPTNVTLTLQRNAFGNVTANSPSENNHRKQSTLVRQLVDKDLSKTLLKSFLDYPIGVIYQRTVDLSETDTDMQGTYYTFPHSESKQFHPVISWATGAFVTLNDLLPEITSQQPVSTTIEILGKEVYVVYTPRPNELFLIAIPSAWCSLEQAVMLTTDIVCTLEFIYESLSKCFTVQKHLPFLDHFFSLIIGRLSNTENSVDKINYDPSSIENKYDFIDIENYKFESSFQVGSIVQLPRGTQIQIDAALNEMEAMDYREWNEDPMDCQRLYTILGSCVYHKTHLLRSHFAHEDLIQIQSFLRHSGILHLISKESVKCLVSWKRVYPSSCYQRNDCDDAQTTERSLLVPNGKWFLLVVGYGHDLLAALLESGGCTTRYDETIGPDVFYVEEAQETLKHIQKIGVMSLAEKCIASVNNESAIVTASATNTATKAPFAIAENLLGFIKPSEVQNESLSKPNTSEPSANKKNQEASSILKLRNSNESPVISGSMHSLQTSEDSLSQGTGAISEISDEAAPILGRRATRERVNNMTSRYSDDSDSDMDIRKHDNPAIAINVSSIRESLLNQAGYAIPIKLTTGERDYLLRCVHLDAAEGIMLTASKSLEDSLLQQQLLSSFNKCVHVIHQLLQNAVRFKKVLSQDIDKTVINKSLVAIKEHGILFEWENISYWVVGRLYMNPNPKEIYVCYQDSAPQNLIEIAFRLN